MSKSGDNAWVDHPGIIKVIGIGQSMRGDDAAGLAAVRLWDETYQVNPIRSHVQVELAELPGIALLDILEGASAAILVDAVRSGSSPGKVHVLYEGQLEGFTGGSGSAHGWGVAETLTLGRKLMPEKLPSQIIVIGIEAGQFEIGSNLSSAVDAALPEAALQIEQCIQAVLSARLIP